MTMSPYWIALWAMLIAVCAIAVVRKLAWGFNLLLDRPNHRSLHAAPIPRIGGVCIWLAVVLSYLFAGPDPEVLWALAGSICLVVAISLLDDWRAQPVILRLSVHLFSAALAMTALFPGQWVLIAVAAVGVTWSGNLFNFMDGADGLAGAMAIIGFATLGLLAAGPSPVLAAVAFAVAGATAGFLVFNLPPARVFLGDAGSVPLGFTAAVLSIWGTRDGVWHGLLPVLVFLPFLLDASWTLADRVRRGERFWQAHREHLYQRLILAGWSHGRLLASALLVMLCVAACALLAMVLPREYQGTSLGLACLSLTTLYATVRVRLARRVE